MRETEAVGNRGRGGDAGSAVAVSGGGAGDGACGLIFRYSSGSRGVLSTLRKLNGGVLNSVRQQFPADSCNKSSSPGQYDFREIMARTMMEGALLPENWFACLRRHYADS